VRDGAFVLDARRDGFEVLVLEDAIRPVEVEVGDGARALQEMAAAGASLVLAASMLTGRRRIGSP